MIPLNITLQNPSWISHSMSPQVFVPLENIPKKIDMQID